MKILDIDENNVLIFIESKEEEEEAVEKAYEIKKENKQVAVVLGGDKDPEEVFKDVLRFWEER